MFRFMERRLEPAIPGRGAQGADVPTRFGLATREVDGDWRDHMETLDGPKNKKRCAKWEKEKKKHGKKTNSKTKINGKHKIWRKF